MSGSNRLRLLPDGLSWLGVQTRIGGAAFLMAASMVGTVLWFGVLRPVEILQRLPITAKTDDADRAALVLSHALQSSDELVVIIGGSATRELTPNEPFVSKALTRACGRPLTFLNLGTSSQTFAEGWALAELASRGRLVTVIAGLNYYRLEVDRESTEAEVTTMRVPVPQARTLVAWLWGGGGRLIAPFTPFADTARALRLAERALPDLSWAERLRRLRDDSPRTEAPPPDDDYSQKGRTYYVEPVMSPESKVAVVAQYLAARTTLFRARAPSGIRAWEALFAQVRGWGATPVAAVLPEDSVMLRLRPTFGPVLESAMSTFAATGVHVVDLRRAPGLQPSHFFDQQHLTPAGRRVFWPTLLRGLAVSVPNCVPKA